MSFCQKQKRWIVATYWFFVLLAIPIWWKTTEIYRAKLPLKLMDKWAKGQMCNIQFDIPVIIDITHNSNNIKMIEKLKQIISTKQEKNIIKLHIKSIDNIFTNRIMLSNYMKKKNIKSVSMNIYRNRTLFIDYHPHIFPKLPKIISETLLDIFSLQEKYINFYLKATESRHKSLELDNNTYTKVVKYSSTFDIVFSLVNGDEKNVVSFWDIKKAEVYFRPLLRQLSALSEFNVESQIHFCSELTFNPYKSKQGNMFQISIDQFPEFVNFAEWNLETTFSSHKIINFLVYVPPRNIQPLFLKDLHDNLITTNSFLVPQWGSIIIHNQNHTDIDISHLNITQLQPIFHIFISNFLSLLGTPSLPSYISIEPLPVLNAWRLDGLYRQRITENIISASETLGSLARLAQRIHNMVIPDQVQQDVSKTIDYLKKTCQSLNDSKFSNALNYSRIAVNSAEKAFFDPSMVSMLYFPDEHKYGVYLPLFGPLFFPLVIPLLREFSNFLKSWKTKRNEKKEPRHTE
ncbi:unnamed protein product [Pneumocystis jirovecii]|uniref:GPI transamidase component PIG-S n=1 Tax=Pneumocystis jirovecii TaxID=42068 RepID=L0PGT2_PNEJI|nr:unnamed protein product [Pneumocystis jirovecii]